MGKALLAGIALCAVAGCGGNAPAQSGTPTARTTPAPSSTVTPSAARSPLLVVADSGAFASAPAQVRLARLDATDVGTMTGAFIAVVDDEAIALDGRTLKAMSYAGVVTVLGSLAHTPSPFATAAHVVVSPDLTQWLYTTDVEDANHVPTSSQVHLGSATADRVIATLSPDSNQSIYVPYAWNASGAYVVLNATGIGGAGAFLEYDFPLSRIDVSTGQVTVVSPNCNIFTVFDDGTIVCRGIQASQGSGIEIRAPGAPPGDIVVSGQFGRVRVSSGETTIALAHNRGTDAAPEYQMATIDVSTRHIADFGPAGYLPDAWLPDGRLVANRSCAFGAGGPGCGPSNEGTYILSADGATASLWFQLKPGAGVAGVLT